MSRTPSCEPRPPSDVSLARALSIRVRARCIDVTRHKRFGHLGPDLSAVDLLCALYVGTVRFPCGDMGHPERDRFVLSKGHAALALYAVLVELGWWPPAALSSYGRTGGLLGGHPSSAVRGIETCTGALGHGLPFAVGAALAAKTQRSTRRTFVLLGDGELQEGSNWEAAMLASTHGLDQLTAIVDRNRLQQGRGTEEVNRLEPLRDKWLAFGWSVMEVDGHDHHEIVAALGRLPGVPGKPTCIIARTTKGKGVSFMEDSASWHHKLPSVDEAEAALDELLGVAP